MRSFITFVLLLSVLLSLCGCFLINKNPVWLPIPDATVNIGELVTRILSDYVSDPDGDELTFTKTSGPGSVNGDVYSYTAEPPLGEQSVTVRAMDERGKDALASFKITVKSPPNAPSSPNPANNANLQMHPSLTLSWTGGDPDGDSVLYDIYLGTTTSPVLVKSNHDGTSFSASGLISNKKYYWKVVAKDGTSAPVAGPLWAFTTGPFVLVNETFESYTIGAAPNLPWGTYQQGGSSYCIIANCGNPGKGLMFEDPTDSGFSGIIKATGWSPFKHFILEFDFRISTDGYFGARMFSSSVFWDPFVLIGNMGSGWGIYAGNGNDNFKQIKIIYPNTWYRLGIRFNYSTGTYEIYLDGGPVGTHVQAGPSTSFLTGMEFTTFSTTTCPWLHIDNVLLLIFDEGYTAAALGQVDTVLPASSNLASGRIEGW